MLYLSSFVISVLGIIISFYIIRVESALDIWWNLAGIFSGGMLGIFLLGYFARKVENVATMIGVALGLLVIIWMSLSPVYFTGDLEKFSNPLHSYMTIVVGTMVIFREDGGNWDIGYPRSVQRTDGKIVTIYYYWDPETGPERYIAATIWDPDVYKSYNQPYQ